MQMNFFKALEPVFRADLNDSFLDIMSKSERDDLHRELWTALKQSWSSTTSMDSEERCSRVLDSSMAILANSFVSRDDQPPTSVFLAAKIWKSKALSSLARIHHSTRSDFFEKQSTSNFLGSGARKLYEYVRHVLGVPFHKGLEDHPTPTRMASQEGPSKKTIGSLISIIYESLRSGDLHTPMMEALAETESIHGNSHLSQEVTLTGVEVIGAKYDVDGEDLSVKVSVVQLEDVVEDLAVVE